MLKTYILSVGCLFLTSCATQDFVKYWEHYDQCSVIHQKFEDMVQCGKEKRLEHCGEEGCANPRGNAFMSYSDSLVASVRSKQISEEEAQRKWITFRNEQEDAYTRDYNAMIARRAEAIESIPMPKTTTCNTVGTHTYCNSF